MNYIDPHAPDADDRRKAQIQQDKAEATRFDRDVLFDRESTYNGSKADLARMAARAGKPMRKQWLGSERTANQINPAD